MKIISKNDFWGLAIIALPLLFKVGNAGQRFAKDSYLVFFLIASILIYGMNKISDFKLILLFLTFCFFHQYDFGNFHSIYNVSFIIVGFLLFANFLNDFNFNKVKKYIAIACLVQCALVFFNYFGVNINNLIIKTLTDAVAIKTQTQHDFIPVVGSLGHSNVAGSFIALSSVALFGSWFAIIPFVAVVATQSLMSIATFLFCAAIHVIGVRHIYKYLLIIPILFVCAWTFTPSVFSGRIEVWKNSLGLIENKFIGNGIGSFPNIYNPIIKPTQIYEQIHNEYLEIYFSLGIIGLIFFVYFICKNIRLDSNKTALIIFLGTLFNSIGHFTYHIGSTALLGIMTFAVCTRGKNV